MPLAELLVARFRRGIARTVRRAENTPTGSRWPGKPTEPWDTVAESERRAGAWCPICRWQGDSFEGVAHSESALCPQCGSIARDRMLFVAFTSQRPPGRWRVLETSPRLGDDYRAAMGQWFRYTSSDFDERAHKGAVRLDLQNMDFPDASVDVVLTPHVLEHVPDTDLALSELFRVLAPGGSLFLQVPVLQGVTAPPAEPEFHGDNTPVFWRFGFDLTARLRSHGFHAQLLCTEPFLRHVQGGSKAWPEPTSPEFDVASMLESAVASDLQAVTDQVLAARLGLVPAYMFLTWSCRKPD